jgi:peroxiredoxin
MPRLQKEYSEYRERGYELLAITLSRGDKKDREKIQALKEKYGLTYPLLMDTEFEVATKIYGLSGPIPLKAIIDCQGKLRYSHVGDYADGISEVPFVLDELLSDPECNP